MDTRVAAIAGVVALIAGALAGPCRAAQEPYPDTHTVDTGTDGVSSVVTADFDGDGDLDIAATIRWDDTVSWWENPSWTEHTIASDFDQASCLVVVDLDEDGWPDLVGGKRGSADGAVTWWRNPGTGGGAWTANNVSGPYLLDGVRGLAAGDIDDDGHPDIAATGFVTGFSDGIVMWFINTGNGTFDVPPYDVDLDLPAAYTVAVGDVDGDGHNDLVAASSTDDTVVWYRRTTIYPYSPWERHSIATGVDGAMQVAVADLDSDRDLDVVVSVYTGDQVLWLENLGDGATWGSHVLGSVDGPYGLDIVDLDRDGDIDIVASGRDDGTLRWFERSAPGSFVHRTLASVPSGAKAIDVGDLDNDGDLDVAVAADYTDTVVWVENGATRRTAKLLIDSAPCALLAVDITDIEILDIDRDGHLDFLASVGGAVPGSDDLLFGLWTPSGFVCSTEDNLPGAAESLVLAEDSHRFAVVGDDGFLGKGHCYTDSLGVTASTVIVNVSPFDGVTDAVPVDLNGNQKSDLVAVSPVENLVVWWRYDSTPPTGYSYHVITTLSGAFSVRAADLDRDGDKDLAVMTSGGDLFWFENDDGDGLSWTSHSLGLLAGGVAMRIGDINNDGWPDLVAAGDGADEIRWWQNGGLSGGSLVWTSHTVLALDNPGTLELADLDRDGALDIVVSRPDAGALSVIRNSGGLGLSWVPSSVAGSWFNVVDLAIGDVLLDGYPDLLVADPSWGTLAAVGNRGGQFGISALPLAPDTLAANQIVPIFALIPAHMGRLGDLALELRAVNLSVDDGLTPLTTTQLRSVFSSLSLYYDANENYRFDAGSDWPLVVNGSPSVDATGALRLDVPHSEFNPPITRNESPVFFVAGTTTADPSAGGIAGVRLVHRYQGWWQLRYEGFPSLNARPEYFGDVSSGLMAISSEFIFANGFELGNTAAWSATVQ